MDVYTEITGGGDSADVVEARSAVANPMTNGLTRLSAKRKTRPPNPAPGGCENDYAGLSTCNADEESNCHSIRRVKTHGFSNASLSG